MQCVEYRSSPRADGAAGWADAAGSAHATRQANNDCVIVPIVSPNAKAGCNAKLVHVAGPMAGGFLRRDRNCNS